MIVLPHLPPALIATILRKTAERLEQVGWLSGGWRDEYGRECAQTALVHTSHAVVGEQQCACGCGSPVSDGMVSIFTRYLGCSIPIWNDMRAGSLSEVTTTLRRCADRFAPSGTEWEPEQEETSRNCSTRSQTRFPLSSHVIRSVMRRKVRPANAAVSDQEIEQFFRDAMAVSVL